MDTAETALGCSKARYYNPNIGRFVSEDPKAWNGGVNFYSHVLNQPINYTDPSGLKASGFVSGDVVCRKKPGDTDWKDVIMFTGNDTICVWGYPTSGGKS